MLLLLSILACSTISLPLSWSGYLYQEDADGFTPLPDATMSLKDQDGTWLMDSELPYSGTAHYHNFALENTWVEQNISVLIQSPTTHTILWNGQLPDTNASWLPGTLFAPETSFIESYFVNFDSNDEILWSDEVVHVWGQPLIPEDWSNVQIEIWDGDGTMVEVQTFAQVDSLISNDTSNGIQWFFAWNLSPGDITITITSNESNESISSHYPTTGGEIISSLFYALPESWSEDL